MSDKLEYNLCMLDKLAYNLSIPDKLAYNISMPDKLSYNKSMPDRLAYNLRNKVSWDLLNWRMNFGQPHLFEFLVFRFIIVFPQHFSDHIWIGKNCLFKNENTLNIKISTSTAFTTVKKSAQSELRINFYRGFW